MKGVVAALHFILGCSARYDVTEEALALELQQLGLPKEHTEALVASLRDGRATLQSHFAETSLRLPRLEALRYRVHEDDGTARAHTTELYLSLRDQVLPGASAPAPARNLSFRVDADTLTLLHAELQSAREAVEAVKPSS